MQEHVTRPEIAIVEDSNYLIVQLLVDCTHHDIVILTGTKQSWLEEMEAAARGLIYALHMSRSKLLGTCIRNKLVKKGNFLSLDLSVYLLNKPESLNKICVFITMSSKLVGLIKHLNLRHTLF